MALNLIPITILRDQIQDLKRRRAFSRKMIHDYFNDRAKYAIDKEFKGAWCGFNLKRSVNHYKEIDSAIKAMEIGFTQYESFEKLVLTTA